MDKTREDLIQTLVQNMMSVMRHVGHGAVPSEPELSPPQVRLLLSIARNPGGTSVKELAEMSGITPGAITQFVDVLVEKGLVIREGDPNDRRVVRLKLSDKAWSHHEKFKKDYLASVTRVFEVLSNEELKQLINIISKIDTSHGGKGA